MANEGSTKPTYSELAPKKSVRLVYEAYKALLARDARYSDPDNLEWEWADADKWERHAINAACDLRDALDREIALGTKLSAAKHETERVRGLLQRITDRYKSPEGTDVAEIMELIKGAESAVIGKLDAADESGVEMGKVNRVTFSQGAPPMAGTPSIVPAGSAETGGEKAAPEKFDTIKLAKGICREVYGDESLSAVTVIADTIDYIECHPNFRRPPRNQTASSGVEGAHEGTTADKSVALAESSLSSPPQNSDSSAPTTPEPLSTQPDITTEKI